MATINAVLSAGAGETRIAAAWAALLTVALCLIGTNRGFAMDDTDQLLDRMRSLPEAAYQHRDQSSIASLTTEALKLRFRGILLSAPRSVDGNTDAVVPGLLLMARSRARSAILPFGENAMAVATDLDRGASYAAPAFPTDPTKRPIFPATPASATQERAPPKPARSPQEQAQLDEWGDGDSARLSWLDFRQLLKLPRQSARYMLRVIDFDQVSNPALVEVEMKPAAETVVPLNTADVAATPTHATAASHDLPRYERTTQSPTLTAPGAALVIDTPITDEGMRRYVAHGAIRLEVSRQMMVERPAPGQQSPGGTASKAPAALVQGSVFVVMKGHAKPMRIELQIPVWSDQTLHPGDIVDAAFSIDLAPVMPAMPPAGVYQVYLLVGQHFSGPHALTLPAAG